MAGHESVVVPHSRSREAIVRILKDEGFIEGFKLDESQKFPNLVVVLKYGKDRRPAIQRIKRVSKPGCRIYAGNREIPSVLGGLGITIISTSKGIMSGKTARSKGVGGEVLCEVY
jgi:small subunit ribosomal protein S8